MPQHHLLGEGEVNLGLGVQPFNPPPPLPHSTNLPLNDAPYNRSNLIPPPFVVKKRSAKWNLI